MLEKFQSINSFSDEFDWLSNFYIVPVKGYPSLEHYYISFKQTNSEWKVFCKNPNILPGKLKRLSQKITLREGWKDIKIPIMYHCLNAKFSNPSLRAKLLATDKLILIEGNTWKDSFWGVYLGFGENHLGRLLMKLRKELNPSAFSDEGSVLDNAIINLDSIVVNYSYLDWSNIDLDRLSYATVLKLDSQYTKTLALKTHFDD